MNNPAASLYDDLAKIDEALEPFRDPQISEHPGLRWMQQTLVERREHVREQIEKVEHSALTVALGPAPPGAQAPAAETVAALLTVLQQELHDAAASLEWPEAWPHAQRDAATTLHVAAASEGDGDGNGDGNGEPWSLDLRRAAGPLAAQPTMPDGEHLVFDAAVARLLDRIDGGQAEALARLVVERDLPVTLTATAPGGETRTLQLDQQRAQSLLLRA